MNCINLNYIREAFLSQLKSNIAGNLEFYKLNEPWLDYFFGDSTWKMSSKIIVDNVDLVAPQKGILYDIENTQKLYEAFKNIKVSQATDERLWVFLTHVVFWDYMRQRWPIENKKNPQDFIKQRYYFSGTKDRQIIRNGISRLWWFGYLTYDETREDPFELTKILLKNQDIQLQILERNFSRNPAVLKAILSVIGDLIKTEYFLLTRDSLRNLVKYLNRFGGVTLLDSFSEKELKSIVRKKIGDYLSTSNE